MDLQSSCSTVSPINQTLQSFPTALWCKLKFILAHKVLSGQVSSCLSWLILHHFPPFGVLNVSFSSATGPLLMFFSPLEKTLPASLSTSSLHFPGHCNSPLSAQLNSHFPWAGFPFFCVPIPHSISPWSLSSKWLLTWALSVPIFVWLLIRKHILLGCR